MSGIDQIKKVSSEIAELFSPEKIILYSKKINFETGDIKSFAICVIVDTPDTLRAEKVIYLTVESELPFDVLVYTPAEWKKLIANEYSFAHTIIQKGTVLYEKR